MFFSFIDKYLGNLFCFHLRKLKTSFVILVVGEKVLSSNCIVISFLMGPVMMVVYSFQAYV